MKANILYNKKTYLFLSFIMASSNSPDIIMEV